MSFQWESIIQPAEVIQKEFSISARYIMAVLAFTIVGSVLVALVTWYVGIAVFVLGLLYWYYLKTAKHYCFTDRRIVLVESFLGTTVTSIDYNQVTDIEMAQSVVDQLGGWGTLVINTAGTHSPVTMLTFIDNVQAIKQDLDRIRDSQKKS